MSGYAPAPVGSPSSPASSVDVTDRAARRAGRTDVVPGNPSVLTHLEYWAENLAPAALTVRATRTVATGNLGVIDFAMIQTRRRTAATTADRFRASIRLIVGGTTRHLLSSISFGNSVENDMTRTQILGAQVVIQAGNVVEIITEDNSTGGAVDYQGEVVIREYAT